MIGISLTDSTVNKDDPTKTKVNESETERVQRAEVWAAVSETLDSFLFPEFKPPQVKINFILYYSICTPARLGLQAGVSTSCSLSDLNLI